MSYLSFFGSIQMVETLYCSSIVPSKHYFPRYDKIKEIRNDLHQRYVALHKNISLESPVITTKDHCFIVCRQRPTNHMHNFDIDHQVIIVVTDTKENRVANKLIHNSSSVKVSYLQNLKEVASLTLEESMFKPMKTYAERLDDILHNNRKHGSEKYQKMPKRKIKTEYRKAPYRLNIEFGKGQTKKVKQISQWEQVHTDTDFHHLKDSAERLYNEIIGMFDRSRLKEDNKPKVEVPFENKVGDEVLNELYKVHVCPNVKSCGYRYATLQVFVNDICNEKINSSIGTVLKSHGIGDFKIVPAICTYKNFLGVGAKVCPTKGETPYGSLGGFARKNSRDMCAFISRHVAIQSQDKKVSFLSGKMLIQSNIISETVPIDSTVSVFDISATKILSSDVSKCDTKFKSEQGVPTTGKDCIYDKTQLRSRRVHLWGAVSTPGLGIINMPEIRHRDRNEDNAYLIVENRANSTTDMSKKGDSGAMVCADDDYGSRVEIISMLIGEDNDNPGKYATLRIDKGLEQLEKQTKFSFILCKD